MSIDSRSFNAETIAGANERRDALLTLRAIVARSPKLTKRLQKFDVGAAVSQLSGLLTRPENQAVGLRLEVLIHLAVLKCRGTRMPTPSQIRGWLNSTIDDDPAVSLEDPVEDVFVTNVITSDGNARLFEGLIGDNDFFVQSCIAALSRIDADWARRALTPIMALLHLSETIAARSGVARYTLSDGWPGEPIRVAATSLEPGRVTFSVEDLIALRIRAENLKPFMFEPGMAGALLTESIGHTGFERRPLMWAGGKMIVALPTAIGSAIRRFVIEAAVAADAIAAFLDALAADQFQDLFHLARVGLEIRSPEPATVPLPPGIRSFIGTFDDGAFAHVVLVADDIDDCATLGLLGFHRVADEVEAFIAATTTALMERPGYVRGMTLLVSGGIGLGCAASFVREPPGWQHLVISMPDLMRLGFDSDMSACRLWKLMEQEASLGDRGYAFGNLSGFMNLYAFARRDAFNLVPSEMGPGLIMLQSDFVTGVRNQQRVALDRHAVRGPDGVSWIEVQRQATGGFFQADRLTPIFVSPGHGAMGELLACVETTARPWWVLSRARPGEDRERLLVFKIWESARNWLVALAPILEARLDLPDGPITVELQFPDVAGAADGLFKGVHDAERPGVLLHEGRIVIVCQATYLAAFADSMNIGDRWLVGALIEGCCRLVSMDLPDSEDIVQAVVKTDDARFFHAIPSRTLREALSTATTLPEPRFVEPEDRAASRLGLAFAAGATTRGLMAEGDVGRVLNAAVDVVWERVARGLRAFDRRSVVARALLNNEAVEADRRRWRSTAAALSAIYADQAELLDVATEQEGRRSLAGIASRVLAEMAVCTCPLAGGRPLPLIDFDAFIAEIATILECAGQSDLARHGLGVRPPTVCANGSFDFDATFAKQLQVPYVSAHGGRVFRQAAEGYAAPFEERQAQGAAGELEKDFSDAFACEFGLEPVALGRFIGDVGREAMDGGATIVAHPRSALLRKLADAGAADAEKAYAALALVPRPHWNETKPVGARPRDWYPWRFNRRLSLTRRPLVQLSDERDPDVLVAPGLVDASLRYFCEAAVGRLPAELFTSAEMQAFIGAAADREGHRFNHTVADGLQKLGWETKCEVPMTHLGAPAAFGDIDVLAWRRGSDIVYAIECKRLHFARTIGEICERLGEYTATADPAARTPIVKHLDRMARLHAHLAAVASITEVGVKSLVLRSALVTDGLVPMQFSGQVLATIDVVVDFSSLGQAFGPRPLIDAACLKFASPMTLTASK